MTRPGTRRGLLAGAVLALCTLLPGCAVFGTEDTVVPAPAASPTPSAAAPAAPAACDDATTSYEPDDASSGSAVARIKKRGRLVAGVSADSYLLGARDPLGGKIQGFDIDFVKAMAKAILGDEDALPARRDHRRQRIPALESGQVDLVARAMTMTCDRWKQIAFSSEYYRAGQKIMVRAGLEGHDARRPGGQRVCAPNGTSSMDKLRRLQPEGHGRRVRQPHRVPGAVPAGTGRRDHRGRHRARRPRRAGPVRRGARAEGLHRRAVRAGHERRRTWTSCASSTPRLAQMRSDGEWTRSTTGGSPSRSDPPPRRRRPSTGGPRERHDHGARQRPARGQRPRPPAGSGRPSSPRRRWPTSPRSASGSVGAGPSSTRSTARCSPRPNPPASPATSRWPWPCGRRSPTGRRAARRLGLRPGRPRRARADGDAHLGPPRHERSGPVEQPAGAVRARGLPPRRRRGRRAARTSRPRPLERADQRAGRGTASAARAAARPVALEPAGSLRRRAAEHVDALAARLAAAVDKAGRGGTSAASWGPSRSRPPPSSAT